MAENSATATDDLVFVTIKVGHHEHGGIVVLKGTQIKVDKKTAEWMLQHHIIEG